MDLRSRGHDRAGRQRKWPREAFPTCSDRESPSLKRKYESYKSEITIITLFRQSYFDDPHPERKSAPGGSPRLRRDPLSTARGRQGSPNEGLMVALGGL